MLIFFLASIATHRSFQTTIDNKRKPASTMPSCSSRRSNHCFARRFHPYALNPMAAFLFDDDDDDDMIPSASFLQQYTKNKARWNEEESNDSYTIDMDVPGVKLQQITVEETNGEIEITAIRVNNEGEVLDTYQDIFYVPPSAADLSNTTATLKDGVLTIKVPKKVYRQSKWKSNRPIRLLLLVATITTSFVFRWTFPVSRLATSSWNFAKTSST